MQTITLEISAGVARLTLNRPEVHNAFNETVIRELDMAITDLGQDPNVRVIVLRGAGKSFSAGADIDWMRSQAHATDDENRASGAKMAGLFTTIDHCPKPIVAGIQGAALGGGSGLTCCVDIAIAAPNALFGFTEVRLGIIPAVISPFVMRRLGYSEARARFLTGSRFGAEEALRIGMVHAVADDLDAEVEKTVQELLAGATGAHAATKALIREIWDTPHHQQLPITAEATAKARASAEGKEGLSAFLDKRKPNWHPQAAVR
ncbi:MAG: enoyl-CoA hydratase-related protein [Vulcanimicrobiota bacterium]